MLCRLNEWKLSSVKAPKIKDLARIETRALLEIHSWIYLEGISHARAALLKIQYNSERHVNMMMSLL